jgi:hypothetical protein
MVSYFLERIIGILCYHKFKKIITIMITSMFFNSLYTSVYVSSSIQYQPMLHEKPKQGNVLDMDKIRESEEREYLEKVELYE